MARGYPRFLYSNPKSTKSKGPFIVHNLYPRMICRLDQFLDRIPMTSKGEEFAETYEVVILEVFDKDASKEQVEGTVKQMCNWVTKIPELSVTAHWYPKGKDFHY